MRPAFLRYGLYSGLHLEDDVAQNADAFVYFLTRDGQGRPEADGTRTATQNDDTFVVAALQHPVTEFIGRNVDRTEKTTTSDV